MDNSEMLNDLRIVAKTIGLKPYEFNGMLYKHPVDDRDACASWNPLLHPDDSMELQVKLKISVRYAAGSVDAYIEDRNGLKTHARSISFSTDAWYAEVAAATRLVICYVAKDIGDEIP